jgi:hypothetical protein
MVYLVGWSFVAFGLVGVVFWVADVVFWVAEVRESKSRKFSVRENASAACLEWVPAALLLASGIYIVLRC